MKQVTASRFITPDAFFSQSSLPFNRIGGIVRVIEPAKAMRANVSSNWRVFRFWGYA
jgi:hypothetical protein